MQPVCVDNKHTKRMSRVTAVCVAYNRRKVDVANRRVIGSLDAR